MKDYIYQITFMLQITAQLYYMRSGFNTITREYIYYTVPVGVTRMFFFSLEKYPIDS